MKLKLQLKRLCNVPMSVIDTVERKLVTNRNLGNTYGYKKSD